MSIFDIFKRQPTRNTALRSRLQYVAASPSPAGVRALYAELLNSTVVIVLNQQASEVKNGALLTPRTGANVEFATSIDPRTQARVVPVFVDVDALSAFFAVGVVPKREISIPHVRMRARDVLPIIATAGLGIELHGASTCCRVIDNEMVRKLAEGRLT